VNYFGFLVCGDYTVAGATAADVVVVVVVGISVGNVWG